MCIVAKMHPQVDQEKMQETKLRWQQRNVSAISEPTSLSRSRNGQRDFPSQTNAVPLQVGLRTGCSQIPHRPTRLS